MSATPLAGLRVVEFAHMVMGPTTGLILADLGADVVKIEPTPAGDNTRRLTGSGIGFFTMTSRNKRSVVLDLKSAAGLEVARRLIARADVLTENFRPGALDKLGLGYADCAAANARLIYCSLKGFLPGPYEHRTALDEVVQMMGGLAYMTGPVGQPLRAGSSVIDIMGGTYGAVAILAALAERERTGKGQLVQSGLFESVAMLMAQHMAQAAITGTEPPPMSARDVAWPVYDIFATADAGQIFIGVVTDTQWQVLCTEFGLDGLARDPELTTQAERRAARPRTLPVIAAAFGQFTKAELAARCERLGLPFAPIARPVELFDDAHLRASGGLVDVSLPDGRVVGLPGLPISMAGQRPGVRRDVPQPGADTRAVLLELGYGEADISAMRASGSVLD
ncbi:MULTISPECIES: CaiB/BaiF CoA transferase family protein [Acidiphilium]|uniref:Crotonobetainyl-CoA:carnitine CoA-transferase CaiB n=1 Tax=Acidiphilium rubrum TaxID=526 RepID=A0A8G2CHF9_ACIRU|nr:MULTISPECIES: CaiB/BaiF CoA-transferase family protein [Acidiphilium]SIQ05115.1 Crotonobetainyl-CoA:carnitine CoA-transferase CaiB [Acidiphilium rubrum]